MAGQEKMLEMCEEESSKTKWKPALQKYCCPEDDLENIPPAGTPCKDSKAKQNSTGFPPNIIYIKRGEITDSVTCRPKIPCRKPRRSVRSDPLSYDVPYKNKRVRWLEQNFNFWDAHNAEQAFLESLHKKPYLDCFPVVPTSLGRELQPQSWREYRTGSVCRFPDLFPRDDGNTPMDKPIDEVMKQHINHINQYTDRQRKAANLEKITNLLERDPCEGIAKGQLRRGQSDLMYTFLNLTRAKTVSAKHLAASTTLRNKTRVKNLFYFAKMAFALPLNS